MRRIGSCRLRLDSESRLYPSLMKAKAVPEVYEHGHGRRSWENDVDTWNQIFCLVRNILTRRKLMCFGQFLSASTEP